MGSLLIEPFALRGKLLLRFALLTKPLTFLAGRLSLLLNLQPASTFPTKSRMAFANWSGASMAA